MLKLALWLRRKFQKGNRLRPEKWFKFLPWSTQRRIGRLSPFATMGHCGFIMAHGRELRIYRKLLIDRAIPANANKLDFGSERGDRLQLYLFP
jgi:hypothetical protein